MGPRSVLDVLKKRLISIRLQTVVMIRTLCSVTCVLCIGLYLSCLGACCFCYGFGFVLRYVYYDYSNFNFFSIVGFLQCEPVLCAAAIQGVSKRLEQTSRVSYSHQNKE